MQQNKQNPSIYRRLFTATFSLSMFTIGGGYVIVPLMRKKFVEELGWIDEEEMLNLVAIGQSAPGPIAVNTSLLAGYKVAGVPGAMVTVLGTVLPPLLIISLISLFYGAFRDNRVVEAVMRGMQAGVAAVIADAVIGMGGRIVKRREPASLLIMAVAFAAVWFFQVNVVIVILAFGLFGAARALLSARRGEGGE